MKKNLLRISLLTAYLFISLVTFSQSKLIKGRVTDAGEQPLSGATVTVSGQKNKAVATNADGTFEINASPNAKLVITMMGYEPFEIRPGEKNPVAVSLTRTSEVLSEVVVTALGIKKDKRNLTFSSQEVKGDEITRSKDPFLINAISGKVAGVQITNASGTPGSSSRILVRGATSLYGNNEALTCYTIVTWTATGAIYTPLV